MLAWFTQVVLDEGLLNMCVVCVCVCVCRYLELSQRVVLILELLHPAHARRHLIADGLQRRGADEGHIGRDAWMSRVHHAVHEERFHLVARPTAAARPLTQTNITHTHTHTNHMTALCPSLPGCTQARKATHGKDGQHQDVDRTHRGRASQNDRDTWRKYVHGVANPGIEDG